MLAIGLVLILEQLRRGVRTPDDVRELLSRACLGILPHRGAGRAGAVARHALSAAKPSFLGGRAHRPDAAASYEVNLRTIRARLWQDHAHGRCDVVAVVSALPGEGKSTFACNLALAAAAAGTNTLLIDGDVYTGSLTRMFGIKGPGLCEVLAARTALWPAMRKHQRTGLHILGARADASAAAERGSLDASAFESLLETCRKTFDLVVIDSPAILPVAETTAPICFADRAVLIVEWQRTDREAVAEAIDLIGPQHSHKITGVVLNKVAMGWYRLVHDDRYLGDYVHYGALQPARLPATLEAGGSR